MFHLFFFFESPSFPFSLLLSFVIKKSISLSSLFSSSLYFFRPPCSILLLRSWCWSWCNQRKWGTCARDEKESVTKEVVPGSEAKVTDCQERRRRKGSKGSKKNSHTHVKTLWKRGEQEQQKHQKSKESNFQQHMTSFSFRSCWEKSKRQPFSAALSTSLKYEEDEQEW